MGKMLKSEIHRRIYTKNSDLLELEGYEREAHSAWRQAEHVAAMAQTHVGQFDSKITQSEATIKLVQAEIAGAKQELRQMEKWTQEARKAQPELKALAAAAGDPTRFTEKDAERFNFLRESGYETPETHSTDIYFAQIRGAELQACLTRLQAERKELKGKNRELSKQYRDAKAHAREARIAHEKALRRMNKVKREIAALNAKLGNIPTPEVARLDSLDEEGPVVKGWL